MIRAISVFKLAVSIIAFLNSDFASILLCIGFPSVINAILVGLYFAFTGTTYDCLCSTCHKCMKTVLTVVVASRFN